MITLLTITTLAIILLIAIAIIVLAFLLCGIVSIFVVGDIIVCVGLILWFMTKMLTIL